MNKTEKYVQRFYESIDIFSPEQLSIQGISESINIPVMYWEYSSEAVYYRGKYKIFLGEFCNPQKQWQEFGHEMCHILGHEGNQKDMPSSFLQLQEEQANYFSYHFCVPTFMLWRLKDITVYQIMNLFNVEFSFASKRLIMFQNKILGVIDDEKCKRISI